MGLILINEDVKSYLLKFSAIERIRTDLVSYLEVLDHLCVWRILLREFGNIPKMEGASC